MRSEEKKVRGRSEKEGIEEIKVKNQAFVLRHFSLQYFTWSQSFSHFLRQVKGRWQTKQIFCGRFSFFGFFKRVVLFIQYFIYCFPICKERWIVSLHCWCNPITGFANSLVALVQWMFFEPNNWQTFLHEICLR